MAEIKKIGMLSLAKIQGIIMFVFGLFMAILALTMSFVLPAAGQVTDYRLLLIMPVMYGVMGFVIGLVTAALYNLISKYHGGLQLEIKK